MATLKEQKWLVEYLKCWNETEAARRAGYKWPNKVGSQKRKKFDAEIKACLRKDAMDADEVVARLAWQARADIGDFVDGAGELDLAAAKSKGLTHLVKSVTWTNRGPRLELHGAQTALVHLGRHLGLFTDKVKIEGDWRGEISDLLKSGKLTLEQIQNELGTELATELFKSIGLVVVAGGKDSGDG